MSENYGDTSKAEPDFFCFYTSEVTELLSQDESIWPFSNQTSPLPQELHEVGREKGKSKNSSRTKENNGTSGSAAPLFSNGIGALISEFKNERLKSLLRQSVFSLTQEVDEIVEPILSLYRIRSRLRYKERLALECKADQTQHAHKKQRLLSSLSLCNACGLRTKKNGLSLSPAIDTGKELIEIDDDLRIILENDSTKVEELMKRHSSEFLAKLQHMEQKLQELLNTVMTSCRPMTLIEKQQLRNMIQNLPPKNLDCVVEIIEHNKPPDQYSSDEINVELDNEDKVTLWRLYFYVTSITKQVEDEKVLCENFVR